MNLFDILKRKRKKLFLLSFITSSLLFLFYQSLITSYIDKDLKERQEAERVWRTGMGRNISLPKADLPAVVGGVYCLSTGEMIPMERVNDDYCDCFEGTDEPETDACPNGSFSCKKTPEVSIPSSRINDGICDCCDGSDEWKRKRSPIHLKVEDQRGIHMFLSPCPDMCLISTI